MLKQLSIAAVASLAISTSVQAEYYYGFGGVYVDHQNWDHGPRSLQDGNNGADRNQAVLGLEGGAGFSWGELYGFYEYENISRGTSERGASLKGTAHINLGDKGVTAYAQVFNFSDASLSEQNRVIGLGYTDLQGDGWFFKPWIGVHDVTATSEWSDPISGMNGYMAGWTGMYAFDLAGQNFSLVNWNEIEFDRNDAYAAEQGGKNGLNGAVVLSWHVTDNVKMGVTYRYFKNKLGINNVTDNQGYGDALIYRIGYDF